MTHSKPTAPMQDGAFEKIHAILTEQVQAVLATQFEGNIFQHLMAYDMEANLATIYLASFEDTRKIKNIRQNPNVSLLWDNRTGNNHDHVDGFALSAQGSASLLDSVTHRAVREDLLARNETLGSLLNKENAVLVGVSIKSYHLVVGYSQSYVYSLNSL